MTKCAAVAPRAMTSIPAPAAIPIMAVSHTIAAVVNPATVSRRTKMMPAQLPLLDRLEELV